MYGGEQCSVGLRRRRQCKVLKGLLNGNFSLVFDNGRNLTFSSSEIESVQGSCSRSLAGSFSCLPDLIGLSWLIAAPSVGTGCLQAHGALTIPATTGQTRKTHALLWETSAVDTATSAAAVRVLATKLSSVRTSLLEDSLDAVWISSSATPGTTQL